MVIAAGIYAGSKVKDASDFMSGANKAKWQIITGTIIGILVGGSSTLGTVKWIICMGCRVGGLH